MPIRAVILLHDIARFHLIRDILDAMNWKTQKQHPYNPDLSPCDYFLLTPVTFPLPCLSHIFSPFPFSFFLSFPPFPSPSFALLPFSPLSLFPHDYFSSLSLFPLSTFPSSPLFLLPLFPLLPFLSLPCPSLHQMVSKIRKNKQTNIQQNLYINYLASTLQITKI